MRMPRLIGTVLFAACLLGLVGCTPQQRGESESHREARQIIEDAIGGRDNGSVTLVTEPLETEGEWPGTRTTIRVCVGRSVTLSEQASATTLTRVLTAFTQRSGCADRETTISFAGHDTVLTGDDLFFAVPPSDLTNISAAVYENWPREVHLDASPDNAALFRSYTPSGPAQLGPLADAVTGASISIPAPLSDGQAPVRIRVTAEPTGEAWTPDAVVTFDPELSTPSAELVAAIAQLDAARPGTDAPIGIQLDIAATAVTGTVMLPFDRNYGPQSVRSSARWGEFPGDLPGSPEGFEEPWGWSTVWANPSPAAITVASDIHALIAQTGLRDEVEIILVHLDGPDRVNVGHFDPAVPSAQHGLASTHPDWRK